MERRTWTGRDAVLYALAVGASGADSAAELAYSTEDVAEGGQRVLPSFASVVGRRTPDAFDALGDVDLSRLVLGEQSLRLHRALPVAGDVEVRSELVEVLQKRTGTLVRVRTTAVEDGEPLFEAVAGTFLRGVTGVGEVGGSSASWSAPAREPDVTVRQRTNQEQALLYRLTGDMNPLHASPERARRAGFPRPILHGLCTYGFAGRALLRCRSELNGMSARFSAPVYPGDELVTHVWRDGDELRFVVDNGAGDRVLDRGSAW